MVTAKGGDVREEPGQAEREKFIALVLEALEDAKIRQRILAILDEAVARGLLPRLRRS